MEKEAERYMQELFEAANTFDQKSISALDFCSAYRGKVRKILNLVILLATFKPSVASALKLIRDRLDAICPET